MVKERLFFLLVNSLYGGSITDYKLLENLTNEDWVELMNLARINGVKHLIFDAISGLPVDYRPSSAHSLKWYVDSVNAEMRYERYLDTIEQLTQLMEKNMIPLMIVKGFTLARLYNKPSSREGGDIDLYLFDNHKAGDELIHKLCGNIIERIEESKHSNFILNGFLIENHSTFVASEGYPSVIRAFYNKIEEVIQQFAIVEKAEKINVRDSFVYTLNCNAAALHIISHLMSHVIFSESSLRQLTDWVVFFNHYRDQLDREWLESKINELNLEIFVANVENFCKMRLGFAPYFNLENKCEIYNDEYSVENLVFGESSKVIHSKNPLKYGISLAKHFRSNQKIYSRYLGISYSNYFIPQLTRKIKRFFGFKNN